MAMTYAEIQKKEKELRDALQKLEQDKEKLLAAEATKHFEDIYGKMSEFFQHFTAEQKAELKSFFPSDKVRGAKKVGKQSQEKGSVQPKYELPTGEKWSGRGRTPIAFQEWKKANPDHEYPAYPHKA